MLRTALLRLSGSLPTTTLPPKTLPDAFSIAARGTSVLLSNLRYSTGNADSASSPPPDAIEPADVTVDQEALLKEYYESFTEEVWRKDGDDERDVRWMEMLGRRGVEGVFDLEEIVDVLKFENVTDICVIRLPAEMNYADYFVIGNGFSLRHLKSTMEYIKKLHKAKRGKKDRHVTVEGLEAGDWLVADMGNLVLHLFMEETRESYDLESLWCLGEEFDPLSIRARTKKAAADEDFNDFDDWSEEAWEEEEDKESLDKTALKDSS